MALTTKITASIKATESQAADLGSGSFTANLEKILSLSDGSGNLQAAKLFSDIRTLAASATENLDLAGALTSAFGATITFATIKAIMIVAAAGNTNDVIIGGAASNGFLGPFGAAAHTIQLKPGGVFLVAVPNAGWTVTAGTGDLLKIANAAAGTSVDYSVIIIGT